MKNCKISTICFENTLFPLPSFFILKKKKKGLHKETWRKVWMLIRSPNSFNKKEKELRAFTHWLIKVEVSRRALITRARDPIGEGSDRPFNVSTRGGGRRGGGVESEAFYVGSLSRARATRLPFAGYRYKEGAGWSAITLRPANGG